MFMNPHCEPSLQSTLPTSLCCNLPMIAVFKLSLNQETKRRRRTIARDGKRNREKSLFVSVMSNLVLQERVGLFIWARIVT